jgi:hypothetical protein
MRGHPTSSCRAALALLAAGSSACAVQLSSGHAYRTTVPELAPRIIEVSAHIEDMRADGPILGARGTVEVVDGERPLTLRHAMVDVGYQVRSARAHPGFEAALDLGLGEPSSVDFDGIGGYVGARLSMPIRVYGDADADHANNYSSLALMLDVVPSAYGGVWTEPFSSATETIWGDFGGLLGIRVGLGTDAARSPAREARR